MKINVFAFAALASLAAAHSIKAAPAPAPATAPAQAASVAVVPDTRSATQFRPTALRPHSRVWERAVTVTNGNRTITRTHSFTELQTGLAFTNPATGRLEQSDPNFIVTNGYAYVERCQHQVIVSSTLNPSNGVVVDVQTPDGKRIRNGITGLNLYDPVTEKSMQVSSVRDIVGTLTAPNEITWVDACDGLRADVRVRNERAGVHQDILLREKLSTNQLSGLGFDPNTVRLEIWTLFDAPNPTIEPMVGRKQAAPQKRPAGQTEIVDQNISFDAMKLGNGMSFVENDPSRRIRVPKQWIQTTQGVYLVESVLYADLLPLLDAMPVKTASLTSPQKKTQLASGRVPPSRTLRPNPRKVELARANTLGPTGRSGRAVLDYVLMNSQTNVTFLEGETYYISGPVNLSGTTVFQPNSVLKFTNDPNAHISMSGSFTCSADPYKMCLLTSKDNNLEGENIPGSTGSPTNYNGATYLLDGTGTFRYMRFSYAGSGIDSYVSTSGGTTGGVWHCQFINCNTGMTSDDDNTDLHNVLFWNCGTAVANGYSGNLVRGEHVTLDQVNTLMGSQTNMQVSLTNSILTAVTNVGTNVTLVNSLRATSGDGVYQVAGAGAHYLIDGSTNRQSGNTNISAALLGDLTNKTTYPPIVKTQAVFATMDTTLSPVVTRIDSTAPDIGFAYDPLDFQFGWAWTTNALTVTVTPGTVIGTAGISQGSYGMAYAGGANLICNGLADNPVRFIAWTEVQEGKPAGWQKPWAGMICQLSGGLATLNCRFVDFSSPAQDFLFLYDNLNAPLNFRDCQFHAGQFHDYYSAPGITNCLFERTFTDISPAVADSGIFANCLFLGGEFYCWPVGPFTVRDNLFDRTSPVDTGLPSGYGGYNAFVTNYPSIDTNATMTDIILADTDYVTGPQGRPYFYPTNGTNLATLIDHGSISNAALVGLFHFTTIGATVAGKQFAESNSPLDVGWHRVATDTNGVPLSTSGDGIGDYLKDSNGNGIYDSGDAGNWLASDTVGDGVSDRIKYLQGRNLNAPAFPDTNGLTQFKVYTPLK